MHPSINESPPLVLALRGIVGALSPRGRNAWDGPMTTKNWVGALGLPANSTGSNESPKGLRPPILVGWECEKKVTGT